MNYLSLFSGIGAFEKAMNNLQIPFDLVGYSEIDKYASNSYSEIHGIPESMNLGDITKIDEKKLPKVDLITYGFPCQDISIAGKQQGLLNDDGTKTRSGLFFDALRIIEHTQPIVAIAENVKNLVGKKFNPQFQVVLASLESAGYNNYWAVLNSKNFGVPQNRERVFIVSIRKDYDTGLFEFPKPFPLEKRLKDVLEDVVDKRYYFTEQSYKCLNAILKRSKERGLGFRSGIIKHYDKYGVCACIDANYHKGCDGKRTMIEELDGSLRMLTPKECFRIMGFTDEDFEKCSCSNTQLYKQAGNSIVVDVAEELLCMLFDEEGKFFI